MIFGINSMPYTADHTIEKLRRRNFSEYKRYCLVKTVFGFKESSLSSLNSNGVKEVAVPSITAVKESKFKVMWLSSYFVAR